MATNIVTSFSLLVFLLSTACCLAAPMCSHNVEDEPAGAIRHLMAGLRVVDTIAVRQFSSLVLSSTSNDSNASITQEEPEAELSDTMSAFGALEIMCSQHALLRSLWDSPLARQNAILTTIRSFGQQLLRPTCEWVQLLMTLQYPTSNFSFGCHSDQEIAKICHAHNTVSFSETLNDAISAYNKREDNLEGGIETRVWIDKNLSPDKVLPEVYQLINSVREDTPT